MNWRILLFCFSCMPVFGQGLEDFISITPQAEGTEFIIPSTHVFQKFIERGDPLTAGGTMRRNHDFTAYVPINGSSENGYLSINSETAPGAVTVLDINFNSTSKLWNTTASEAVDFSSVVTTAANCSGAVTPWNTVISCEEVVVTTDLNFDGYNDVGWCVEIDPVTKTLIDKRWALGNFAHENVAIHGNHRTVYQGADSNPGYLYKFVADVAQDLSNGSLYAYQGSKNGSGIWIELDNDTPAERNSTLAQCAAVGATVFNGIEDVEIGPDGLVYFAVKGESRVYRFQDSDPISGTTVPAMETYVGNASYAIVHEAGTTVVPWGSGNDNLAFDNAGNLWVLQDGGNHYIWVVGPAHTQAVPQVRIFGSAPIGSEPTGITFSPDYRFLFMSIQHPDSNNGSSFQTDAAGNAVAFDLDVSLVIARKENLGTLWYLDADGDGYAVEPTVNYFTSPGAGYTTQELPTTDCDDSDPAINPDTVWYKDEDNDGFASANTVVQCTSPGMAFTTTNLPITDCDDTDPLRNPDTVWYEDQDGDGFATQNTVMQCESPGTGFTTDVLPTTDCDDTDPAIQDEGAVWYRDSDGDGYAAAATVVSCSSPGSEYTIQPLPTTDCDDSDSTINPETTWYEDQDGDGYATTGTIVQCESPGAGFTTAVLPTTDCDDTDPATHPDTVWYEDQDGDGFALPGTVSQCTSPGSGFTTLSLPTTDCNDLDPQQNPDTLWYPDSDGNGFADGPPITQCESPGMGYTMTELPSEPPTSGRFVFHPNPVRDMVTISLEEEFPEVSVSVFNSIDQLWMKQDYGDTQLITINLISASTGLYIVQISSEGKIIRTVKILRL